MKTVVIFLKACAAVPTILLLCVPAQAREIDIVAGGTPILQPDLAPMPAGAKLRVRLVRTPSFPVPSFPNPLLPTSSRSVAMDPAPRWTEPLMDRTLTQAEKSESLAPDLQDAINRIEPVYDPTRLDGPVDAVALHVSAGSASMADVFGERWHLAADDPNINLKVRPIGLAWSRAASQSCDQFSKRRHHDFGEAALTALTLSDCRRVLSRQSRRFDDAAQVPIASAPTSVPVFAAPLPGARMSSQDFWAAQKARIDAMQAHLQRKWVKPRANSSQRENTPAAAATAGRARR